MSDCFSEECLTATWWSVEEHTLGGLHAEFVEFIGVFNGIQDHFPQVLLDILESTDVFPGDVGNFDNGLSETGGVGLAHSESEVFIGDCHSVEHLCVDGLFLNVDHVHLFTDALQCGLCAQGGHIGAHVTVRLLGHFGQIHVL